MSTISRNDCEMFAAMLQSKGVDIPVGIKLIAVVDFNDFGVPVEMRQLDDIEHNTRSGIRFYLQQSKP